MAIIAGGGQRARGGGRALDHYDVIIIGAGAAGQFCASVAGQRGRRVLLIDHAASAGEKIRISGGGRCNFTNLHSSPAHFLSVNPHFCISALAAYGPADFIALVERHGIPWHEKTLGQLFCDRSAQDILDLLAAECRAGGVEFALATRVLGIERDADGVFRLATSAGPRRATRLVIATGGPSIPRIGASDFAYGVARRFGLGVVTPRPGLVPLIFDATLRASLAELAGVSVEVEIHCGGARFVEALLFTHRGLSGPAVLQASSYWEPGAAVTIDLAPGADLARRLREAKRGQPRLLVPNLLAQHLPRRLAQRCAEALALGERRLADVPDRTLDSLAARVHHWQVMPAGTEGLRKAEVTVGGVDTRDLDSRTLEARDVPGLHFIGEAVDVTGHLGGHNFQWAWASGHAAGRAL